MDALTPAVGRRVRLVRLLDHDKPPPGTKGIVRFVDDMGTLHTDWEDGATLGLVPSLDEWDWLDENGEVVGEVRIPPEDE